MNNDTDQIDDLLKTKPTVLSVLASPSFIQQLDFPNVPLLNFLSGKEVVHELVQLITNSHPALPSSHAAGCEAAFKAFSALSSGTPQISSALTADATSLKLLLSMCRVTEDTQATSLGYFQEIFKTLLSPLTAAREAFVRTLKVSQPNYLSQLVNSMTTAHANCLKYFFQCDDPQASSLKQDLFDFLMYTYLNEKFAIDGDQRWRVKLLNVIDVVNDLGWRDLRFTFKPKYIPELFSCRFVANKTVPELLESIYYLKLTVIRYITKTELITSCDHPAKFAHSWTKFPLSRRRHFYALAILDALLMMADHDSFKAMLSCELLHALLFMIDSFRNNDVVHNKAFRLVEKLAVQISASTECLALALKFFMRLRAELSEPTESVRKPNPVAVPLIYSALLRINFAAISQQAQIDSWLQSLKARHSLPEPNSEVSEVSEIESSSIPSEERIESVESFGLVRIENFFTKEQREEPEEDASADVSSLVRRDTINDQVTTPSEVDGKEKLNSISSYLKKLGKKYST